MRAFGIERFEGFRWLPFAIVGIVLAGCGGGTSAPEAALSPAAALGEKIFSDANLSASGQMSCATCHSRGRGANGSPPLFTDFTYDHVGVPRNVAVTAPYFHNGRFKTLKELFGFYVRRDTNPEEWDPLALDGTDGHRP